MGEIDGQLRIDRVLVGVDGSRNAEAALRWAVGLARRCGAEVLAVHAVGLLAHLGPDEVVPSHSHRDQIRAAFEGLWCAPLVESGLAHRLLLVDGSPVSALLDVARDEAVDLIVLGTRGLGGAPGLALGSTAHQVVQLARSPVLVVPPPPER